MNRLLKPFRRTMQFAFKSTFRNTELKKFSDSFLGGSNAAYIESLFDDWHRDPKSVSAQWDAYFNQVAKTGDFTFVSEPEIGGEIVIPTTTVTATKTAPAFQLAGDIKKIQQDHINLRRLINLYRIRGHEKADIDPLRLRGDMRQIGKPTGKSSFDFHRFFTDADLDREFYIKDEGSQGLTKNARDKPWSLRRIIEQLEKVYCGKVAYEYMHLNNVEERNWIRTQIEDHELFTPTKDEKLLTFERLCKEHCFTYYLSNKFSTSKRFGIEGCDALISGLQKMVDVMAQDKVGHIVFGMAHRGRLNTLYNVFDKSAEEILAEFQDLKSEYNEEIWGQSGDVKYHLGQKNYVKHGNHTVRLEMLPNASHLEAVNPIVYGNARAVQDYLKDKDGSQVASVLIHGDASISGQGIVYESFQMADLVNYSTKGMIHVVANNQIGFTTVPSDSRSGLYCTDIAHSIQAPVFHVNADEPELVDKVFEIATKFRQKFKKDVFVDIIGYRRFGHNELDQPQFTQPIMYGQIAQTPIVFKKYCDKLIKEGLISQENIDKIVKGNLEILEQSYMNSRKKEFKIKTYEKEPWEKLIVPSIWGRIKDTGIPMAELKEISETINTIPDGFNAHPQIAKVYKARRESIQNNSGYDWATAEALAFAGLLKEGFGVRLSGQDVERGTFSHRHALLTDQDDPHKEQYMPLSKVINKDSKYRASRLINELKYFCQVISNSHLSEFGVLGFDYGYSLATPNYLVCWEGQFGDFANGAQIIIDNFIVSAESKWNVESGIVMMLPNGMDGQGPEHSSARLERYLQLSDDDPTIYEKDSKVRLKKQIANTNLQICQVSTPANYFHAIRRQIRRQYRKPLIMFNSKRLLRYVKSYSYLEEIDAGTRFNTVYPEKYPEKINQADQVEKVLICSGQLYYDLITKREELHNKKVAIVRVEQLAPFPYFYLHDILKQYTKAKYYWVQEEHENYGPWNFVRPRINRVLSNVIHSQSDLDETVKSVRLIGRSPNSSPATGNIKAHEKELAKILAQSFE